MKVRDDLWRRSAIGAAGRPLRPAPVGAAEWSMSHTVPSWNRSAAWLLTAPSFCRLIATGEIDCRADLTDDTRASGDCRLLYTKEEPCAPSPIRPDRKPTAVA
jgi:hypothetical protein